MYDYYEAVKDDVLDYIKENIGEGEFSDRDSLSEHLNDTLWTEDSVTGNASGSYFFNAYKAEEALCHNWDLLSEALQEFCCTENPMEKGAEWCDVIIRCYILAGCIDEVVAELDDAFFYSE